KLPRLLAVVLALTATVQLTSHPAPTAAVWFDYIALPRPTGAHPPPGALSNEATHARQLATPRVPVEATSSIPLKRGGADTPSNMQWQTIEAAKAKDRTE